MTSLGDKSISRSNLCPVSREQCLLIQLEMLLSGPVPDTMQREAKTADFCPWGTPCWAEKGRGSQDSEQCSEISIEQEKVIFSQLLAYGFPGGSVVKKNLPAMQEI